ncbi:MAG: ATP synthase F1 subunit gamma [Thermotogae bacterium]|nr:ATP synthase F1 subunit gamma [Thermotogota bacterium]
MSKGRLRQIQRRIQSTGSIMQITRAMEMVARAKVQKVEKQLAAVRRFEQEVTRIVSHIVTQGIDHPLLKPGGKKAILVLTSDMGLCGAFNTDLMKKAEDEASSLADEFAGYMVVGARGAAHFRKDPKTLMILEKLYDVPDFATAERLVDRILEGLENGTFQGLKVVHSKFRSALIQRASSYDLIPVTICEPEKGEGYRKDWEFEPEVEEHMDRYLFLYLAAKLFSSMFETKVSEFYARMNAMKNATENAEEVIRRLTLDFNKARQAAITQEIIEVVNGAESLKE